MNESQGLRFDLSTSSPSLRGLYKSIKNKIFLNLKMKSFFVLLFWGTQLFLSADVIAAGRPLLDRHFLDVIKTAPLMGAVPSDQQINLAIGLPLRNQEALNFLLKEISDRNSSHYRKYLTPQQFSQMFGPLDSDYQKVIAFARSNNLTITKIHEGKVILDVRGTASDIQKAFNVNLNQYQRFDGSVFYSADREPSVDLDVPVAHVSGLDSYSRPMPTGRMIDLPQEVVIKDSLIKKRTPA